MLSLLSHHQHLRWMAWNQRSIRNPVQSLNRPSSLFKWMDHRPIPLHSAQKQSCGKPGAPRRMSFTSRSVGYVLFIEFSILTPGFRWPIAPYFRFRRTSLHPIHHKPVFHCPHPVIQLHPIPIHIPSRIKTAEVNDGLDARTLLSDNIRSRVHCSCTT